MLAFQQEGNASESAAFAALQVFRLEFGWNVNPPLINEGRLGFKGQKEAVSSAAPSLCRVCCTSLKRSDCVAMSRLPVTPVFLSTSG